MAIPEEQLATWAQIGAVATSRDTYASVRRVLVADGTAYGNRNVDVFLQGSYGNDTNIWKESDVDVVILLRSVFTYELSALQQYQQQGFNNQFSLATYSNEEYYADVLMALRDAFGNDVVPGTKAISIKSSGNRRKSDVLVAREHRHYFQSIDGNGVLYVEGISFSKRDGTRVVNYPRLHHKNLIAKNQATNEWYKHIVRIFKNARERMIDANILTPGTAPSYYIEGLLYNVPLNCFGTSYQHSVVACLNWLRDADRDKFVCAHGLYSLLDGDADTSWTSVHCATFLRTFIGFWNDW